MGAETTTPKYDYHTEYVGEPLSEEALNKLGAQGWELVSHAHNGRQLKASKWSYVFIREATE